MSKSVNSVMVIGYGTMGRGILETFAKNGFEAAVLTRDPSRIKDLPAGADAYSELPDMAPDLIIESIPEDMTLKHGLLQRLEDKYGDHPVYGTNTSGLPIETAMNILEPACPGLDETDRLVRDYAVQVTTDSKRVSDAMFAALRERFDEAQVVELTVRTAMCGFYNRFNEALRLDIEDGVLEDVMAKGGDLEDLPADELKDHAAE